VRVRHALRREARAEQQALADPGTIEPLRITSSLD
jgi:hypothetical protein